jgi:hypothetical protein
VDAAKFYLREIDGRKEVTQLNLLIFIVGERRQSMDLKA